MQNNFDSPKAAISPICDLENVCDHWGKSKNTVYRWIRMGKFPAPFYQAGKPYWNISELTAHQDRLIQKAKGKSIHKSTGVKS